MNMSSNVDLKHMLRLQANLSMESATFLLWAHTYLDYYN